jgi:hypothetical protein
MLRHQAGRLAAASHALIVNGGDVEGASFRGGAVSFPQRTIHSSCSYRSLTLQHRFAGTKRPRRQIIGSQNRPGCCVSDSGRKAWHDKQKRPVRLRPHARNQPRRSLSPRCGRMTSACPTSSHVHLPGLRRETRGCPRPEFCGPREQAAQSMKCFNKNRIHAAHSGLCGARLLVWRSRRATSPF